METASPIPLPTPALRALSTLESSGHEAWCVGGFVRDALMGRFGNDIDIATSALWSEAQAAFEQAGFRTHETGIKHGTITVVIDDETIEVTTYRVDGPYLDARHPSSVEFVRSIADDLARRDFTVNAMAYHPKRGLLDPFDGAHDIASRIIRCVGMPDLRFQEDALRILRACRFASQLGFAIEGETMAAMRRNAPLLERIASERIVHEMQGFVCGDAVHDALMACSDVLSSIVPELDAMKGFDQRTPYHVYDVLEHTAYVMQNTPPYPLVRWAALFHDMGKPRAFFADEEGVGHFYGHAKVSMELARPVMKRLGMPHAFAHDVLLLVKYHDDVVEPTPKAVKRMLRRLDERVDLFRAMCDLKRGDALSQAPHCRGRVELADELDAVLDGVLEAEEAFALKDLAINGSDLIALGMAQGPAIGALLEACLDAVIDERVENDRASLLAFATNQNPSS